MTGRSVGSPIVAATARAVAPFLLTLGLFTMLHGTKSVGGGFQGGVVVGSVVVVLAFAFGVDQTREALDSRLLLGGAASGLVVFGVVAVGGLTLGRGFLDVTAYETLGVSNATVYAVEAVEIGIGLSVASVIAILSFEIAGSES